jgi:hypothetical protein
VLAQRDRAGKQKGRHKAGLLQESFAPNGA